MRYQNYMGLPEALAADLDPPRAREYIQATGWARVPSLDNGKIVGFVDPNSDLDQLLIPVAHTLYDFNPRMAEVVAYVAEREKRPSLELLYELLLSPADLLFFRESGSSVGSIDIPLDQGLRLLIGVRKILLAATCTARHPEVSHPRWSLSEAEPFVHRCRLAQFGHPFAVTVACPLDAISDGNGSAEVPFARRVTTLLMRSLIAWREFSRPATWI